MAKKKSAAEQAQADQPKTFFEKAADVIDHVIHPDAEKPDAEKPEPLSPEVAPLSDPAQEMSTPDDHPIIAQDHIEVEPAEQPVYSINKEYLGETSQDVQPENFDEHQKFDKFK